MGTEGHAAASAGNGKGKGWKAGWKGVRMVREIHEAEVIGACWWLYCSVPGLRG